MAELICSPLGEGLLSGVASAMGDCPLTLGQSAEVARAVKLTEHEREALELQP